MKVAILHYSFPPVVGGVEKIVAQHAAVFAEHGHDVAIICGAGDEPTPLSFLGAGKIERHLFPQIAPQAAVSATDQTALEAQQAEIEALLRPVVSECEIVFLHNVCTMPFHPALSRALLALAAERGRTRYICWIHDLAAANPDYAGAIDAPAFSFLCVASPHFEYVAVSTLRRQQFLEITGAEEAICRVIPNGIDPAGVLGLPPEVELLCREMRLYDRDAVLLHPTRLLPRKNVEMSLEVAAALRDAGCDCALLITGAAEPHGGAGATYRAKLDPLIEVHDLGNRVVFVNDRFPVGEHHLSALYRVADGTLFPSRQEGFGLPMLESAVHGKPAFCSLIEPVSGFPGAITFPVDASPSAIACVILRTLQENPACQARKTILRTFAWPSIWRNFLAPLFA